MASDAHHGVVEIEKAAVYGGDEDPFLNAGHERAIFFLRPFAFGDVFQDVDGAELTAGRIDELGIGSKKITLQPGIGLVAFAGNTFAIGASLEGIAPNIEELANRTSENGLALTAEEIGEARIGAENAAFAIVNQDGIADGIEGIDPLLLDGLDLFERG